MDKMRIESVDMTAANIEKIGALFPNVITEVLDEEKCTPKKKVYKKAINFNMLQQLLSEDVIEGGECYEFTWVGKKAAIVEANRPIRKILRPCMGESKNWETTENLYIEGDNLEVLKLLQESYLGKVKMIYIDPPYNTGNDFVYRDDFKVDKDDYDEQAGVYDDEDNRLFRNTESNGRFHSDWCSMMYARLHLARNLLTNDGSILISIDDNEVQNLRKLCDEIFGEANFVTQFVWAAGRKNDSKLVSVSHEYILCYVKSKEVLNEDSVIWREKKQGLDEIYAIYEKLKRQYGNDYSAIQSSLKEWFKSLPKTHPAKNHSHYSCVDKKGIYFAADISWPGGGGPKYQVLHPITNNPVKVPSRGWMFSSPTKMQEAINEGRVHFGENENSVPCIKAYLKDRQQSVPYSVFYLDGRASTKRLRAIMGADVFENPKDEEVIRNIIEFTDTKNGIILDFFSGSATTAHSVFLQNVLDDGNRKFILVQMPEKTEQGSKAQKAGYSNISEIGKERIRRAGEKIKKEAGLTALDLDIGFRVLKVDSTNMKDVYFAAGEYAQAQLDILTSNIKEDRTDMDLLYGCLLEWGLPLSLPHKMEQIGGVTVHTVNVGDLIACFAAKIDESIICEIAKRQPLRAVFRDSSFANSPDKINVGEIFKLLAPNTRVKVI